MARFLAVARQAASWLVWVVTLFPHTGQDTISVQLGSLPTATVADTKVVLEEPST